MGKVITSEAAAIALAGTKGGIGKTLISHSVAPAFLNSEVVKIIEIDNNNNSLLSISESKRVSGISLKASGSDLDKAADEAVLTTLGEGLSIVLDFGGGDDSKRAMEAVSKEVSNLEVWIPLTSDFETVKNAIETAKTVPEGIKKILIFSNFTDLKEEYWFVFGNEELGIEKNMSVFEYFDETIEVPKSRLFGLAKLYRTTLLDLEDISKSYNYKEVLLTWVHLPKGEFEKHKARHRLSEAAGKFLQAVRASRKEAKSWI